MTNNKNKQELNSLINNMFQRQRHRVIKNQKAYDRARDRKDKRLYEFDDMEIEENDFDTK